MVMKKLSIRLSIALTAALTVLLGLFTVWIINVRIVELNKVILAKGAASAVSGSHTIRAVLDGIIDNGLFTVQEVFDFSLVPVHMPEKIINGYKVEDTKAVSAMRMYHYTSGLDSYLENTLFPIQEAYMIDPQFAYAVLVDINGYVPVHNRRYNNMPTGDINTDRAHSRSKRIYSDEVAVKASSFTEGAYLYQDYVRDTGESMWDISAPVYAKGRHWGTLRVGFSMAETEKTTRELRNKIIFLMSTLLFICILIIWFITEGMMKSLGRLHDGVKRIAKGDLSFRLNVKARDEIGSLAGAFDKMSEDLAKYLKQLAETISAKERIHRELEIATEIQNSMLPRIFPAFPERKEFDIRAIMEPSKEIGGDMYDFFFVHKDKLYFLISDVSGKGIPAALYMVITKTLLKNQALQGLSADKILANVNNILFPDNEKCMFATAFCGIFDIYTGEIEFSNAGHASPIIIRAEGICETLNIIPNCPLGICPNIIYVLKKTSLRPGDTLFMYTDGVTEAMNSSAQLFGDERLVGLLTGMKDEKAPSIIEKMRAEIYNFVLDTPQSDDITMMVLKYFGN
jgi:serine phosphatase RsbU (regulator of sigma subunit)